MYSDPSHVAECIEQLGHDAPMLLQTVGFSLWSVHAGVVTYRMDLRPFIKLFGAAGRRATALAQMTDADGQPVTPEYWLSSVDPDAGVRIWPTPEVLRRILFGVDIEAIVKRITPLPRPLLERGDGPLQLDDAAGVVHEVAETVLGKTVHYGWGTTRSGSKPWQFDWPEPG